MTYQFLQDYCNSQ